MSENKTQTQLRAGATKVEALLNPKNVVIIGATDKPGNWPQRVWRNLKRYGYQGSIFPYNPTRETVWETRCYRSFAELPEKPDHLVVLAPAKVVPNLLREAAAAGARRTFGRRALARVVGVDASLLTRFDTGVDFTDRRGTPQQIRDQ